MLREPNDLNPVIVDFGLGIFENDDNYHYYRCGTPGYISPEVIRCQPDTKITPKCDIFSLGVVFHVLLAKKYLFEGKDVK